MDYTELRMCDMYFGGLCNSSFQMDYPFLKWIMQRTNSSLEMDILESWIVNIFKAHAVLHHIQVCWAKGVSS